MSDSQVPPPRQEPLERHVHLSHDHPFARIASVEAAGMVDRELLEAIYVMLRTR